MATTDWQRLPFAEQIRYFGEKLNVPTDSYRDISGAEHDAAFVVAGAKGAVLNDLRRAVDRAIAEGTTLEQFRREFEDVVQRTGWAFRGGSAWRSQVIWDTNLRTSYAAGRHEQMQAVATTRPYWQWRHGGSAHPRPQHLALDGKVFRHDDPFWGGFGTPPQGYGCRCSVFTLSDRDLERRGLTVDPGPQLGDRLPIPDLPGQTTAMNPPAGWGHIHGSSTPESRARLLDNVTRRLDPAIAAQVRAEAAAFRASRRRQAFQPGEQFGKLGTVVEPPTIAEELDPGIHAAGRMGERGISLEQVRQAIANPVATLEQPGGKYAFISPDLVVVLRPDGKLITVYGPLEFDEDILEILRRAA